MTLKSFDGKEIFVREWTDVSAPVGFVQIVHGMTEHGGRYGEFARFLNENGFLVAADDHRGHGETDRDTLGYCAGDMFADTVRDEAEITKYYRAKYPALKYFLFGFSYGSFLTQSYIAKYGSLIDGAVIAGSNHKKDFEVYLGAIVARLGSKEKPAKLIEKLSFGAYAKKFGDGEWLSTDPGNNARYAGDPLCGFTCSRRFYRDFFKGLKSLYGEEYREGLDKEMPLFLISGEDDPVGEMGRGVRRLYDFYTKKAGMRRVRLTLLEHSRHEFLNERMTKERGRAEILSFLRENL